MLCLHYASVAFTDVNEVSNAKPAFTVGCVKWDIDSEG